jgi:tRNA1Val (adenine37-N6)-methyltransferase
MTKDMFHFRQFSMIQAPSGQRVNTDSCVFGALIAGDAPQSALRILDVGTGTGVLALMLASRLPASHLTAVEPEVSIAAVAQENFQNSPWADRMKMIIARAQDLDPAVHGTFDLVLCNPPYFQNSLMSGDRLRMIARHNMDLNPEPLYAAMNRMMSEDASAWLSFPEDSTALWMDLGIRSGLHQTHHYVVKDHPEAKPHMVVAGWSRTKPHKKVQDVIHYRAEHQGRLSDWMRSFREEWYPARYNEQFFRPH